MFDTHLTVSDERRAIGPYLTPGVVLLVVKLLLSVIDRVKKDHVAKIRFAQIRRPA